MRQVDHLNPTISRQKSLDFFVYRLASFGFDHNFDHNANDFIWSIAGIGGLFERNIICCDMRASVDAVALKSWLAIISAVPSNFQAENASLNNWIALCRMDS